MHLRTENGGVRRIGGQIVADVVGYAQIRNENVLFVATVCEFVAVSAVTVTPIHKTAAADKGELVGQFETGRAVNRQVFHT